MDEILEILDFFNSGNIPKCLEECECKIGQKNLRIIIIKILSWLNSSSSRPLKLNPSYKWVINLKRCLSNQNTFLNLFEVDEFSFDFLNEVPTELRQNIRLKVQEQYNPQLLS